MKRFFSLVLFITLTLQASPVSAHDNLFDAIAENHDQVNIFEKIIGTSVALPVGSVVGVSRGAYDKTKETFQNVNYSDVNPAIKVLGAPVFAVYGIGYGSIRGLLQGWTNAVDYGFKEEPFSKESFSLHPDWHW